MDESTKLKVGELTFELAEINKAIAAAKLARNAKQRELNQLLNPPPPPPVEEAKPE